MNPLLSSPHVLVTALRAGAHVDELFASVMSMKQGAAEGMVIACPQQLCGGLVAKLRRGGVSGATIVPVVAGSRALHSAESTLLSSRFWDIVRSGHPRALFAVVFDHNCRLAHGAPVAMFQTDGAGCALHSVERRACARWMPEVDGEPATSQRPFWVAGLTVWRMSALLGCLDSELDAVVADRETRALDSVDLIEAPEFEVLVWAVMDARRFKLAERGHCDRLASFDHRSGARVRVAWPSRSERCKKKQTRE